jgi:hypothetical protein
VKPPDTTIAELEAKRAPPPLICPITKLVFNNPILASDGWCYENKAYLKYLKEYKPEPDGLIIMPNNSKVNPEKERWACHSIQKIVESWQSKNFDLNLLKLNGTQWTPRQIFTVESETRELLLMPRLYEYFTKEIAQKQREEQQEIEIAKSAKLAEEASRAPKAFLCPLTTLVMNEPVMASDGYSYEKSALEAWLNKASPNEQGSILLHTGSQINPHEPTPVNDTLIRVIAAWRKTGNIPKEELKYKTNDKWYGKWKIDVVFNFIHNKKHMSYPNKNVEMLAKEFADKEAAVLAREEELRDSEEIDELKKKNP